MSVRRIGLGALIGSALLASGLVFWSQLQETPAPVAVVRHDSVVAQPPPPAAAESAAAPKVVTPAGTPVRPTPARPDTNLLHQLKPPTPPSDTALVQQAFDRLATAIGTEEINSVQLAFPNMPDAERAWFVGFFNRAAGIRVGKRDVDSMTIHRDTADAIVTLHVSYRNKNAAEPNSLQRKYRATLVRTDGGWKITTLVPESR